jgi:hypothetical protein
MGFINFFHNLINAPTANSDQNADLWFQAVAVGDTPTMRDLIVRGIDVGMRDDQERTAMNIASQYGHTDAMTTILAARQMNFLKSIGIDPFALPVIEEQGRQDQSVGQA